MRAWVIRLSVLAVLVLVGFALRATVFAPDPIEVRTAQAERGRVEATVTNSKAGTIEARRRAKLSPGTSGIVVELGARRGQRVKRGDVLLRIDDATQRAALAVAEEALKVAEATHSRTCLVAERNRRELERNRQLSEEHHIVSVDLLDALDSAYQVAMADCNVSESEVEHRRAAVEQARAELEKTSLVAPFDAMIAEVSVELGEWVTPSVPLLAAPDVIDAIDLSSLYVSAPMDEVDAALLRVGQAVRVTIDPYPDRSFAGKVVLVAPYVLDVEQQNRTIEVEVELEDQAFSATLVPGTSSDVEVILEIADDVLRIPAYTLLEGGRVLVVEGERLVEREVRVGLRNWQWVAIESGLSAGDPVVLDVDKKGVAPGAHVTVVP